jgi:hypothetical protein
MSVEALVWALNLAPVPLDRDGKPNSACAFVLVALANQANGDGTAAFPSVHTLVRNTRLSERTVRNVLDRLESAGIISPCDPAIIAAHIRRADHRPQGWNLDLSLIRPDLPDKDIDSLERQIPGLRARVEAMRASRTSVQDGVQPLHPEAGTGCNQRADGVQPAQPRGAAIAPDPSIDPPAEPPAAHGRACDSGDPIDVNLSGGGAIEEFFAELGPAWPLGRAQRDRLAPAITAALGTGWQPISLAEFVGANTLGIRNPFAVLAARLAPGELPRPPKYGPRRKPWCGKCDQRTRFLLDDQGLPGTRPCRDCGRTADASAQRGVVSVRHPS